MTKKRAAHLLRCLGQPALISPSGEVVRIRTKKHLALLVYLAIESRRPHRRDDLAEFLWPKAKISEARHSLSTALSLFRARLGRDVVDAGREKVVIKPGHLILDVDRLLADDILGDDFTPPLEVAAFLEGFDIADAPEFRAWKDGQQARLLPAIKRALVVMMDRCRRTGDFNQIELLAERTLALDDLSEEAVRAKMEARALAGDRIAALRVFEEWKIKLAEEVGAEPAEALARIAAHLRNPKWKRSDFLCLETPQPSSPSRLLIGRQEEYQTLYKAWKRTQEGHPTHVLITGDSGVGKSTLAERFAAATEFQGTIISRVQGYDIEREIPYATISSLITGLVQTGTASSTSPQALAELAHISPDIRRRFPSTPKPIESHGEHKLVQLAEAFLELLNAISEEHSLLLIIDDFHFADDASVKILHLITRRIGNSPIMLLFLTRPGELSLSPEALRLQKNTSVLGIWEVDVGPLSNAASETLLATLLPKEQPQPNATTRRAILNAAAGYPMVLELLVQDWQIHGGQTLALALGAMTKSVESKTAATYSKLLKNITPQLPSPSRKALSLAAILGHRLNELEMYSIIGLVPTETMDALAILVSHRLLRDNGRNLEFRNELIRGIAYLTTPSSIRMELHSKTADHLIKRTTAGRNERDLEIAWHCIRSGREKEAVRHLLCGARTALYHGATYSAEHALSTALPNLDEGSKAHATLLLAELLQDQGRWEESLTQLRTVINQQPCDLSKILTLHANHFVSASNVSAIETATQELLDVLQKSSSASIKAKAVRVASRFLDELRNEKTASSILAHIETISFDDQTEDDAIELLAAKARCLYHMRHRDASLHVIINAINRLKAHGIVNSTLCSLTMGCGAIKCQEGKYEEALTAFGNAHETALRIGNDPVTNDAVAQISLCLLRLGRYEQLIQWTMPVRTSENRHFRKYLRMQIAYYTALGHGFLYQKDLALAILTDIEADIDTSDRTTPWLSQAWHFFKADILHVVGLQKEAAEIARQGLEQPYPILHSRFFAGSFARWLAVAAEHPGKLLLAKEHVSELVKNLDQFDALDRAEILCADLLLCKRGIGSDFRVKREAETNVALSNLPEAVKHQLMALGTL